MLQSHSRPACLELKFSALNLFCAAVVPLLASVGECMHDDDYNLTVQGKITKQAGFLLEEAPGMHMLPWLW